MAPSRRIVEGEGEGDERGMRMTARNSGSGDEVVWKEMNVRRGVQVAYRSRAALLLPPQDRLESSLPPPVQDRDEERKVLDHLTLHFDFGGRRGRRSGSAGCRSWRRMRTRKRPRLSPWAGSGREAGQRATGQLLGTPLVARRGGRWTCRKEESITRAVRGEGKEKAERGARSVLRAAASKSWVTGTARKDSAGSWEDGLGFKIEVWERKRWGQTVVSCLVGRNDPTRRRWTRPAWKRPSRQLSA